MKILYLGDPGGTSGHRAAALERLGHQVSILDPGSLLPQTRLLGPWLRRTGGVGIGAIIHRALLARIGRATYDLIWVDHGPLLRRQLVADLKLVAPKILVYNHDDPFGKRDGPLWRIFLKAVPEYDLIAVVRECNVQEAFSHGARQVMRVYRSADEVAHAPRLLSEEDRRAWASKLLFIGTAFPERGPFMAELLRMGLPLAIYGNEWNRLKQWPILKPSWRGPGLDTGDEYALAIQSAEVCLGLLSKDNRDLHTTRSFEIPSLGGLLCAERTTEHLALYKEGVEAAFWDTLQECSQVCTTLLRDPELRASMAAKGRQRYLANGWTNMRVEANILQIAITGSEELLERHQAALPRNVELQTAGN